ncbi:MAG: sigma-70 family RNA polymerase sigma factor [Terriglobales bacterium]
MTKYPFILGPLHFDLLLETCREATTILLSVQELRYNSHLVGDCVSSHPGEVTQLLAQIHAGNKEAEDRLIPLVYAELRRLAAHYLRGERSDHTLQPTALVHEAYLRLTRIQGVDWQSRSHFFAIAATVMRRILVDHARGQRAEKREGFREAVSLDDALVVSPGRSTDLIALDEALDRLARIDARRSRIVELRFFGGLSEEETAQVLGISARTVKRDWRIAKAWLYNEVSQSA